MKQKEKDELIKRLKNGRINNFKKSGKVGGEGKGMTGKPPFGYYWQKGELKIDEEKADWVRRMYQWRDERLSYRKIATRLNDNGVATNRGNDFRRQSVRNILKNRYYFGESKYNELVMVNDHTRIINPFHD